jgi:CRP-like cAMP-binding protein
VLKRVRPYCFSTEAAIQNHLLTALPSEERNRLAAHLQPVALERDQALWNLGEPIEFIYFPEAGVCSCIAPLSDGTGVEVGVIGREGAVGLSAAFGHHTPAAIAKVQIAGSGLRIQTSLLRIQIERNAGLRSVLMRYSQILYDQACWIAVCNRRHSVAQRLARWLLMIHDRIESDDLALTHGYLSAMLGVRRASVTEAAGNFQSAGLIWYSQGQITLLNRSGLESRSCECYLAVRNSSGASFGAMPQSLLEEAKARRQFLGASPKGKEGPG